MRIAILTNEYPPYVYGGAGVHVAYLTRELARLEERRHQLLVLCFGDQQLQEENLQVRGIPSALPLLTPEPQPRKLFDTLFRDLYMAGSLAAVDLVHCHTWYTHLAGCLARHLTGALLVLTTHSLEPQRPWKVEQLGTAYQVSTWIERTAYQNADGVIAVSQTMRQDVQQLYGVPAEKIRVIPNGIDAEEYHPTYRPEVLSRYGIAPQQPYILFVGRLTRQKGITHLLRALPYLRPGVQAVLCAGAPDTPAIGQEIAALVEQTRRRTPNPIHWIAQMVPKEDLIPIYSQAAVFVCPSVYEPFGIINLEAMACGTPVVASAVGGIPEVVVPGETGLLVPFTPRGPQDFEPQDPEQFARDLAAAINRLLDDPALRQRMAERCRRHVTQHFTWTSIARQTLDFYQELLSHRTAC